MSSAFNRGDSRPTPRPAEPEPAPESAVGSHMLDQILELASGGSLRAGFVEPDDVLAMREVAKTLAGEPFTLEPVAVELIRAVLNVQFQKAGIPPATVEAMARQIAATLCDDPSARQRLEALWVALTSK